MKIADQIVGFCEGAMALTPTLWRAMLARRSELGRPLTHEEISALVVTGKGGVR